MLPAFFTFGEKIPHINVLNVHGLEDFGIVFIPYIWWTLSDISGIFYKWLKETANVVVRTPPAAGACD